MQWWEWQGHRFRSAWLYERRDRLSGLRMCGRQRIYLLRCSNSGCENIFDHHREQWFKTSICTSCEAAQRTVLGHVIRSKKLLAIKDRIVKIRKHTYGNKRSAATWYTILCDTPGCNRSFVSLASRDVDKKKCKGCGAAQRIASGQSSSNNRKTCIPWEPHYVQLKRGALARGHNVEITFTEFLQFIPIVSCFYCGGHIERAMWSTGKGKRSYASYLDRVNAEKPYSVSNLVVCCWPCNYGKGNKFSGPEWMTIMAMRRGDKSHAAQYATWDHEQVMQKASEAYAKYFP